VERGEVAVSVAAMGRAAAGLADDHELPIVDVTEATSKRVDAIWIGAAVGSIGLVLEQPFQSVDSLTIEL
jgi:hypothetical protein